MSQTARPIGDDLGPEGGWTPSTGLTIWQVLDDNSDADYVSSSSTDNEFTCAITVLTDPISSSGHIVRFRIRHDGTPGAAMSLYIIHGVDVIWAAGVDDTTCPANTWSTYESTLTAGEADLITNYANLKVRATNGNPTPWDIAWAEFEIPSLSSGATPRRQTGYSFMA